MQNHSFSSDQSRVEDALRAFEAYLCDRGYAGVIIGRHVRFMRHVAQWCRGHHTDLLEMRPEQGALAFGDLSRGRHGSTLSQCRCSFNRWFDFRGMRARGFPKRRERPAGWQQWFEDYRLFLIDHRGLLPDTAAEDAREASLLMGALFGGTKSRWRQVDVKQIWSYCEHCVRGAKPSYANKRLRAIDRFLQFVHARGACRPELSHAVPHIASFAVARPAAQVLSRRQCKRLLQAFPRDITGCRRDLAMCLCMLELGLRSAEVARLRLPDIDWERHVLRVPPVKHGRERFMPMPKKVTRALRDYIRHERRASGTGDFLFTRIRTRVGQPISAMAVQAVAARAYRRAGLPRNWHGSHRLRHTFATRLFARGASLKHIADLLGHRRLDSANDYTHVDIESLRRVAASWPV